MSEAAMFARRDGRFVPSELTRGPWDPGALHGGAPAALLMRALEELPAASGLLVSRVTYEFLRPVPLAELSVEAAVVRPGRRVQLLEASLRGPDGVEVARARGLQVQAAAASVAAASAKSDPRPAPPAAGYDGALDAPHRPLFAPDAVEIRFVAGTFTGPGPATAWFRLRVPVVAGEQPSPLQRVAAAGDFGNGISSEISWNEFLFINPDLTLYIERPPAGEWIALDARTRIAPDGSGIGIAESVLFDEHGRIGRATQALFVAAR